MNDHLNITGSEILSRFLDGELNDFDAEKNELFAQLANSPELQTEMQDFMAISSAIRNDHAAFVPPADFADAAFRGAGFVPPSAAATSSSISKFWKPALASLLLVSSFGVITLLNGRLDYDPVANNSKSLPANTKQTLPSQNKIANATPVLPKPIITKQTPVSSSSAEIATRSIAKSKHAFNSIHSNLDLSDNNVNNNVENANINTATNNSNDLTTSAANNTDLATNRQPIFNMIMLSPGGMYSNTDYVVNLAEPHSSFNQIMINNKAFAPNNNFRIMPEKNLSWTIYLRSSGMADNIDSKLSNSTSDVFSVGAYMTTGLDNLSIGADFGREPYNWVKANESGSPIVTWVGVSARYDFRDIISESIAPFAALTAAGSSAGPIGKANIGLSYQTSSGYGISVSYESSMLMYSRNSVWNSSARYGLCGSISYSF